MSDVTAENRRVVHLVTAFQISSRRIGRTTPRARRAKIWEVLREVEAGANNNTALQYLGLWKFLSSGY